MLHVVQLTHPVEGRRVAIVDDARLNVVSGFGSVYEAAVAAIETSARLEALLLSRSRSEALDYDAVYHGRSPWTLLPCFDHPTEPARCHVTGTGLTHKASATMRQNMHGQPQEPTDSMRMYTIGLEGGRPDPGRVGAEPEWFYKGSGHVLRAHRQPLEVPGHAGDGGDEAEIAGCYVVGGDGVPYRVGLAQGNEFSDHVLESKNYLYLAASKLRSCAIGPELVVDAPFSEVAGRSRVLRDGAPVWEGTLRSGDAWMCHTLANIEHHHFKHALHRIPGDVHIHFLGADEFSYKDKLELQNGDVMSVEFAEFGRPLRNPIAIDRAAAGPICVKTLS